MAFASLQIISEQKNAYGVYHFSNEGEATWYDFAKAIFTNANKLDDVELIASNEYKTIAKRPNNSVLSKEKLKNKLQLDVFSWNESLANLQNNL